MMSDEEEEKLGCLEKRVVPNVDFDDDALQVLGFSPDIYQMMNHLGWGQFFDGVGVSFHLELAMEILMTMAPVINEGVPSLSFRLKDDEHIISYE